MNRAIALRSGYPAAHDVWECSLTAWPFGPVEADGSGTAFRDIQHRVTEALTVELSALRPGEALRMVTALGGGIRDVTIYRTATRASAPTSQLSAHVGLGNWFRSTQALPPIGGSLVSAVVPADTAGFAVPWARLAGPYLGEEQEATVWSRLTERLAGNRLAVAFVAEIQRKNLPTRGEEALLQGLKSRDSARSQRRTCGVRDGSALNEPLPTRPPAGDYVMTAGVVGDFDALASAWRAATQHSLQRARESFVQPTAARVMSRMSAPEAASLLPLPVLASHSMLPVPRFRSRTTTITRPVESGRSVVVATTDSGVDIAFAALNVNRNMLIVGDVGTGKSVTTMSMLCDLWNEFAIPWLVIDPLKSEYARLRIYHRDQNRPGSDPVRHLNLGQLPINPLAVPNGVEPLAFASAMAQAFSSTSALGEAFPLGEQIARTAFNELYASGTAAIGSPQNPTFADLEASLMAASHQDGMTGETVNNVRTSLMGRLRAITSGVAGDVFAGGPRAGIDWHELSRLPTVLTFPPGLGQQEKAVIYALLVAAHSSWRAANPTPERHLIVLEEVHQVFGRSNPVAAQVLDTLLSTMRASGQGYFAVTQTPHQLDEQTQRLFHNVIAHRTRHSTGLEMFQAFGTAAADIADLDDGEVVALLHETAGVRGRVTDRSGGAGRANSTIPVASLRADEFAQAGPSVRGWCSACPRPCRGRSWLGFASAAAAAADASLATTPDVRTAAAAAVRATRAAASATAHQPTDNSAGLYCASARGVTVALGVRGASDAVTRAASSHVRAQLALDPTPRLD